MKRYFCDMCKKELLVTCYRFNFELYEKNIEVITINEFGQQRAMKLILEVPKRINKDICAKCADKVKERMKGL